MSADKKALSKQEREYEERVRVFAAQAQSRPPVSDLDALLGDKADTSSIPQPPEPPEPALPVQPDPAPEAASDNAPEARPASRRSQRQEPAPAPWAAAHPKVKVPFMLRLPEETHLKLTWLKENMPNTSVQKIVMAAIAEKTEELLKEYYK